MAGRKPGFKLYEAQREKIQASQIINRLHGCVMGTVELSPQQVNAAKALLNKVLPDLSATELSGAVETRAVVRAPHVAKDADEWKPSQPTTH